MMASKTARQAVRAGNTATTAQPDTAHLRPVAESDVVHEANVYTGRTACDVRLNENGVSAWRMAPGDYVTCEPCKEV
jgi:hypothetical protein